jgi:hypothetical protein
MVYIIDVMYEIGLARAFRRPMWTGPSGLRRSARQDTTITYLFERNA